LISAVVAPQGRFHFILTRTSERPPFRARNTIELWGEDKKTAAQPHCVSRAKRNLRRRNLLVASKTAAPATIANDANCCQSMLAT
jgi:hypothetical protein